MSLREQRVRVHHAFLTRLWHVPLDKGAWGGICQGHRPAPQQLLCTSRLRVLPDSTPLTKLPCQAGVLCRPGLPMLALSHQLQCNGAWLAKQAASTPSEHCPRDAGPLLKLAGLMRSRSMHEPALCGVPSVWVQSVLS